MIKKCIFGFSTWVIFVFGVAFAMLFLCPSPRPNVASSVPGISADNEETPLVKFDPNGPKWAMMTYCSCDVNGCAIYEHSNMLKDMWCEIHGCVHVIHSFKAVMPPKVDLSKYTGGGGAGFKEYTQSITSIASMWALIDALKRTLEDPRKFEYVMMTGGDMVIVNMSITPDTLIAPNIPKDANIIFPIRRKISTFGLMSPPMFKNTAVSRKFVDRWFLWAAQGNYIVEDQAVMNVEILRLMMDEQGVAESEITTMMKAFMSVDGEYSIRVDGSVYDFASRDRPAYNAQLKQYYKGLMLYMDKYYGEAPYLSSSKGRKTTSVALYNTFDGPACRVAPDHPEECGYDWNCNSAIFPVWPGPVNRCWMYHYAGGDRAHKLKSVNDAVDEVLAKFGLTRGGRSSVYEKCVAHFEMFLPANLQTLPPVRPGLAAVETRENLALKEKRAAMGDLGGDGEAEHLGGFTYKNHLYTFEPHLFSMMVLEMGAKSVIDVGCGTGHHLRWMRENLGLVNVLCVEGSPDALRNSVLPSKFLVSHDYTRGAYTPISPYDIAWSTEFMQRVEEQYISNWMATVQHSHYLFISGAPPQRRGWHHVTNKDDEWWIDTISSYGFTYLPAATTISRNRCPLVNMYFADTDVATTVGKFFHDGRRGNTFFHFRGKVFVNNRTVGTSRWPPHLAKPEELVQFGRMDRSIEADHMPLMIQKHQAKGQEVRVETLSPEIEQENEQLKRKVEMLEDLVLRGKSQRPSEGEEGAGRARDSVAKVAQELRKLGVAPAANTNAEGASI